MSNQQTCTGCGRETWDPLFCSDCVSHMLDTRPLLERSAGQVGKVTLGARAGTARQRVADQDSLSSQPSRLHRRRPDNPSRGDASWPGRWGPSTRPTKLPPGSWPAGHRPSRWPSQLRRRPLGPLGIPGTRKLSVRPRELRGSSWPSGHQPSVWPSELRRRQLGLLGIPEKRQFSARIRGLHRGSRASGRQLPFGQESHAAFISGPLVHQAHRIFPQGQQNSQLDSSWASNGFVPVRPYSNNFHSGLMPNQLAQSFGNSFLAHSPQGPGLFIPFNLSISPNQGFLSPQANQSTLHNTPRPTSHLQLPSSEVSELDDKQDEGDDDRQDEGGDDEQDKGDDDEQDEGDGDQQRENTPRRAPYGTGRMAQQNERLHARGLCVKCREQNPDLWRKSCPACRIKSAALLTIWRKKNRRRKRQG